ncbi:MAG TPA: uracil-DNA glycosylase [Acidimicrobiales bacterium]|nr:uracil-DNA glycosylase [Acidimicrobiales bacterium]
MFATLDEARDVASTCTRCELSEGRANVVFGIGSPACEVMFIGEGPGAEEDRLGVPFVGRSGQLLDRLVTEEMGLSRDEIAICNTVKCRPPGNRDPKPTEIEACKPFLDAQITHIDPLVIVTLGNFAARLLLDTKTGITKLRGTEYPFRDRVLVPTFHPAAALRGGGVVLAQLRADLVRAKLVLAR